MASHGEEAQGVLFLFILPCLPHIFIASRPPVLPYKPHVHVLQSHCAPGEHLDPVHLASNRKSPTFLKYAQYYKMLCVKIMEQLFLVTTVQSPNATDTASCASAAVPLTRLRPSRNGQNFSRQSQSSCTLSAREVQKQYSPHATVL